MTASLRLLCINGPFGDKKVSSTLGERWPVIISADTTSILISWYERKDGLYIYTGEHESVVRTKSRGG